MATYLGRGGFIGIGQESTWGTGVAASKYFRARADSDSLALENDDVLVENIATRDMVATTDFLRGARRVAGSLSLDLTYADMGLIWQHAFLDSGATTGSDPYTHVIDANDSPDLAGKGLSIWVQRGTAPTAHRYAGCKINGMTLSFEVGSPVSCDLDIIGQNVSLETTPTPTYGTSAVVTPKAANSVGLKIASTVLVCRSATFTINQNYEERSNIHEVTMLEPTPGMIDVTLDAEIEYDSNSAAMFDTDTIATADPSTRAVSLQVKGGTAASEDLKIELETAHIISGGNPQMTGFGPNTFNITWRGFAAAGASTNAAKVTLINASSSL